MSNSNDDYHSVLDSFPYLTLIKVTQSGSETLFWTPESQPDHPEYWGTAEGPPYDAAGKWAFGTCKANVEVIVGPTNVGFCELWQPAPTIVYTIVEGKAEVFWNRGKLESNYCGPSQSPCYTITGGFDVTVERLAAELTLTPSSTQVAPNVPVSLTAEVTPGDAEDLPMPFEVLGGTWYPDSGGTSTPCYPPARNTNPVTCFFSPSVSGTMELQALVNGVEETALARVTVQPCPTGDSALDDPDVRQGLLDALSASNPNGDPMLRHERKGIIWRAPDGSFSTQDATGPGTNQCTADWQSPMPASPIPGSTPFAQYHTHPSSEGDPVYGCPGTTPAGVPFAQYPGETDPTTGNLLPVPEEAGGANGGGSDHDWETTSASLGGYPQYIINKDGWIFRLDPGTKKRDRPKNPNKWRWKDPTQPSCDWMVVP